MFIKSLHLRNFRNFHDLHLSFCEKFNLLVGANAQGKTNVLEAIAIITSGKSFRTVDYKDVVRWGESQAEVKASLQNPSGEDVVEFSVSGSGRIFKRNGKNHRPAEANFILFSPDEIPLLRESPAARRGYIDNLVWRFSPVHRRVSREYSRILAHRNRILQDDSMSAKEKDGFLSVWDAKLAECGAAQAISRADWLGKLNGELPGRYGAIAPEDGTAVFRYHPFCGDRVISEGEDALSDFIVRELGRRRVDELRRGVTLVGPHRDDIVAEIGGREVKSFGSQGQHRSFVLALKIAEIELSKREFGSAPLLMLDDVASELDDTRNRHFFDYLAGTEGQVFITATDEGHVILEPAATGRRFVIRAHMQNDVSPETPWIGRPTTT